MLFAPQGRGRITCAEAIMRTTSKTLPLEVQDRCRSTMERTKPEPIQYAILWAIMADRELISSTKNVATALLLKFRNTETGQCNPSYRKVADIIGMSRDTVMDGVNELEAAGYLTVRGTKGGSARNTNQFEFHMKPTGGDPATGGEHDTGGTDGDRSGVRDTEGVEQPPHELSIEPSRTKIGDQIEADGPDRLLRRPLTGALRDPVHRERTEVVQDRIARRLGSEGWGVLMELPAGHLERLTELERAGDLTDEMLELTIAGIKITEK
jgi:hypothetical protein